MCLTNRQTVNNDRSVGAQLKRLEVNALSK